MELFLKHAFIEILGNTNQHWWLNIHIYSYLGKHLESSGVGTYIDWWLKPVPILEDRSAGFTCRELRRPGLWQDLPGVLVQPFRGC